VFGRRAALAACRGPAAPTPSMDSSAPTAGPPAEETRAALWRFAGLRRDAEGLAQLAGDPYPLARLIGASCLAREESRGAHQRTDHPDTEPALDCTHSLVGSDGAPSFERWE
jgi:L-aspartate oxidase